LKLQNDRSGFIFSLDAALGILVIIIVLAGIARVGGPDLSYREHGYLKLERYANDALEVLQATATLNSIVNYVGMGELGNAENLGRNELRKLLPAEIQFKLVIGDDRLTVYPSETLGWENAFSNAKELAVAIRMMILPSEENYRVLAWLDDDNDRAFMDEIEKTTGWKVTRTSDEAFFRNEILKWDNLNPPHRYYKAVFIPDAQRNFSSTTENNLVTFARCAGRLVVGGDTLWYNRQADGSLSVPSLYEVLGVDSSYVGRPSLKAQNTGMHVMEDNHPITTSPYYICYRVAYSGATYRIYVYRPSSAVANVTKVLAQWDNLPAEEGIDAPPWRGIIFRDNYVEGEPDREGTGVLFNMRWAQSAMGANVGREDWVTMARRAIYWGETNWTFKPITLYVWRGEAVD